MAGWGTADLKADFFEGDLDAAGPTCRLGWRVRGGSGRRLHGWRHRGRCFRHHWWRDHASGGLGSGPLLAFPQIPSANAHRRHEDTAQHSPGPGDRYSRFRAACGRALRCSRWFRAWRLGLCGATGFRGRSGRGTGRTAGSGGGHGGKIFRGYRRCLAAGIVQLALQRDQPPLDFFHGLPARLRLLG